MNINVLWSLLSLESARAPWLSQLSPMVFSFSPWIAEIRYLSHTPSFTVWASAMYSDLVLNKAIMYCLLLLQLTAPTLRLSADVVVQPSQCRNNLSQLVSWAYPLWRWAKDFLLILNRPWPILVPPSGFELHSAQIAPALRWQMHSQAAISLQAIIRSQFPPHMVFCPSSPPVSALRDIDPSNTWLLDPSALQLASQSSN